MITAMRQRKKRDYPNIFLISVALVLAGAQALRAAPDAGTPAPSSAPAALDLAAAMRRAAALHDLGRDLFFAPALSASGAISCATCHDPAHGFTPANDLPVQPGGAQHERSGTRAVPSLTYIQAAPPFSLHHMAGEEDGSQENTDQGPAGGLTWDGRVDRLRDQARIPLLSPNEMANADEASVVRRALAAGFGPKIAAIYGAPSLDSVPQSFAAISAALEAFQQDQGLFFPYSSKFDYWLEGRAKLSAAEQRGYEAFIDPKRGNCNSCHKAALFPNGGHPDFTDFGLVAAAVPRNMEIPANRDPAYFDLGACGPLRQDLAAHPETCGLFKAPSLRNVARKQRFFHNGFARSLRDAVRFYAERDLHPERWYPAGPTAVSTSIMTCRRATAATSTAIRRLTSNLATRRGSVIATSMTSWPS